MSLFELFLLATVALRIVLADYVWHSTDPVRATVQPELLMQLSTGCNHTFLVDKVENSQMNLRVALHDLEVASVLSVEFTGNNQQMFFDLTEARCNVTNVTWAPLKLQHMSSGWCVGHIYHSMSFALDQMLQTFHETLRKFQVSRKPLIVTGFRFGGTYGAMAVMMLSNQQIRVNRLTTFGSPPVGNVFVYNYLCVLVHCSRYVHEHDHFYELPLMPFWVGRFGDDFMLTSYGIIQGQHNPSLLAKRIVSRQAMNEIRFVESMKVTYFGFSKVCV